MRVGLIDVDGHNFPNLCLMKLSAWHKARGDSVEWYSPLFSRDLDRVYMSKVFSFSHDYSFNVEAKEIVRGGTGYQIEIENGAEIFTKGEDLPDEIEHIYPDYSIYYGKVDKIEETAYGFLTRGCPRGCDFCHVACKEGRRAHKVADLSEFWNGQKRVCLCDPNITAAPECLELFDQLIESKAVVEFNQGLDIRLMTEEKMTKLKQIRLDVVHFAWDRYEDKDIVLPKLRQLAEIYPTLGRHASVYVLTNAGSTLEQDLERVYTLRDIGFAPYLMIYNREALPDGHVLRRLQRYVNNRFIFFSNDSFEDYESKSKEEIDDNQMTLF